MKSARSKANRARRRAIRFHDRAWKHLVRAFQGCLERAREIKMLREEGERYEPQTVVPTAPLPRFLIIVPFQTVDPTLLDDFVERAPGVAIPRGDK